MDGFADSIDGFFSVLDTAVKNQAMIAKIPMIGDALQNAVRFVGDIRDKIYDNLQGAQAKTVDFVRQKLFEALGPGSLKWLKDQQTGINANATLDDVILQRNTSDGVEFKADLQRTYGSWMFRLTSIWGYP